MSRRIPTCRMDQDNRKQLCFRGSRILCHVLWLPSRTSRVVIKFVVLAHEERGRARRCIVISPSFIAISDQHLALYRKQMQYRAIVIAIAVSIVLVVVVVVVVIVVLLFVLYFRFILF